MSIYTPTSPSQQVSQHVCPDLPVYPIPEDNATRTLILSSRICDAQNTETPKMQRV